MSATIMDGRLVSKHCRELLSERVLKLKESGIEPHLAVILVGDDPASQIYVRNKERSCAQVGIRSTMIRLGDTCTQDELECAVRGLNQDKAVHGILVQLPLPSHLDEAAVIAMIDPLKDVDAFHAVNTGKLLNGSASFVSCTPKGIMEILDFYQINPEGKRAVVIGRSNIVGKPMALLLLEKNATVTICHSRTKDLASITRETDILVSAIGRPKFVTSDMVKPGAVVIDVGINRVDGKVVGDVDFESVCDIAGYITPVPGGVGPMTITMLLSNTLDAVKTQLVNAK